MTAVCGCLGGAINIFDITPREEIYKWQSNEYSPVDVYWYSGGDMTDYDDIQYTKQIASNKSSIFGLTINSYYFFEEV